MIKSNRQRRATLRAGLLFSAVAAILTWGVDSLWAQQGRVRSATPDVRIIGVPGEPQLTVQIQELSRGPLIGADVTLMVSGSNLFPNGSNSVTLQTDANGLVRVAGFAPPRNQITIDVRVAHQGQVVTGSIKFGGKEPLAANRGGSSKKWLIVAGIGGAVAVAAFAFRGNKDSGGGTTTPTTPTTAPLGPINIRPGTPTIGGPGS